jgi:prepilin-type N-terminal cleavage/methylation domain-containing protein
MSTADRRGFTLLEAAVAIAIVGLAAVAALDAVGASLRATEKARWALQADALARERLEVVALLDDAGLESLPDSLADGTFGKGFSDFRWQTESKPVAGQPGLYDIRVVVMSTQGTHWVRTRLYRERGSLPGLTAQ